MAARVTAKAFVGKEIRRARETQQISRSALAETVVVSESLVAAWESGRQAVRPEYMEQLISVLPFGPDLIARVVDELVNGEAHPEWAGKWLAAERQATSLWSFEIHLMPGLLQTADYARAMLTDEQLINERLERQKILTAEAAPTLVALISEVALRMNVGGPEVMFGQLMSLVEAVGRENVIVQIVPMSSPVCARLTMPFMIATLDNGIEVAYVDSAIRGEVIEQPADVATLRRMFDQFRAEALRKSESIELIRKVAEHWKQ